MNAAELRTALERRAAAIGLAAAHVAAVAPLDRDTIRLDEWLAAGMQRDMTYMTRGVDARRDPALLLPGCRSVVSVALNYWNGEEPDLRKAGKVARYAWGRDYHKVLGARVRGLADWIRETTGEEARSFVDTGPVLERAWAQRAGLGWIGKNANLIRRDGGSWFLLGEVFSVAEIEADPTPHQDFCGSCTACIDACPTDAIVADGVVDAGLCISYWTIERRGGIDPAIRQGIGDWIFGCDICQEVCPWNRRFARPDPEPSFEFRLELRSLDPLEILEMGEAEFRSRFSGTPLMRAKWQGMRRNACVVLGNLGDPAASGALRNALHDPDPVIVEHASWALARLEEKA